MIQVDATPFQWFLWNNDNTYYTLHGAIDDATGKIVGLYMTEHECSYGYYDILAQMLGKYGIPHEIFSDRAAIFCVTPRNKHKLTFLEQLKGIHEKKTHWQKILDLFGIRQILAWSPQAKGKGMRMWRTIQGRLPWYFCFYGIKTVEEANKFLKEYFIKEFNDEFARESKNGSVWKEPPSDFRDKICSRYTRIADKDGNISFDCCDFKVSGKVCAKDEVEVCLFRDRIAACVNGEMRSLTLVSDINNMNDALPEEQKEIIKKYLLSDAKKVCA